MREINVSRIKKAVEELCLKANFTLRKDILNALERALKKETNPRARSILKTIIENARLAKANSLAICQDTGMVFVHLDIGQNVRLFGGSLRKAITDGVKEAYARGCLRKSVVGNPLFRENTKTNTPAIIVTDIVDGNKVKIDLAPKGFGSENKSMIKMFKPTASADEIKDFIIDVVKGAGPDACPPFVLGVGIGGTFEVAAGLAKKALIRPIDRKNPDKRLARLEKELLEEMNSLGMGPMALGGKATALGVNILSYATHIAGLPVAVNMSCHATRSASKTL
ncbi:MAG: fumarate hydratase [Candidatus Omnitrophica bacterium]|nr:fumarate hydratase [Candidatus Omnitrophota bacterium]